MAFPFTSNLNLALPSALRLSGACMGGPVIEVTSPLERIILGRIRAVRASLSETFASSVADGAMVALIVLVCLGGLLDLDSPFCVWFDSPDFFLSVSRALQKI
jgi:hypothetical protein